MRINRLDLTRYGRFTDQIFDFGTATAGKPDLHIIYGPNEAGKSTTFSALLDLLFGIEHKSRYNFLHPYPSMKIGASLQMQNGVQELVRTKARLNSLQDEAGRALPDTLITTELGDIDRDAYRTMFSLDDDTLEQGGEAILASKGNLGELLFSASAGLSGLSQNLTKLRSQSELFYKPNARSGELADLKAQLQDIEAKKAELDAKSSATAYAKLSDAHHAAQAEYQQALRDHVETRSRISETEAMLNALPRLHRLHGLQQQLLAYDDLPDTPFGWAEELPKLVVQDVELRTREQSQMAAIATLQEELSAIDLDERALQAAGSTEHLQVLRARFLTAEKDLPEREITFRAEQQALQALLLRLGQSKEKNPQDLLINVQTETELRSLIESRSGIEAALKLTQQELETAEDRLTAAREKLEKNGTVFDHQQTANFSALTVLLTRLRSEDHTAFLRQAEALVREDEAELRELLQILPYWQFDAQDDLEASLTKLARLSVPEASMIEAEGEAIQNLQTRITQTNVVTDESRKEVTQLEAQLAVLSEASLLITEEEAVSLRQMRDSAWHQHRQTLDTVTAESFETLLKRDDKAVHSRLTKAGELARAFQLKERLAVVHAQMSLNDTTRITFEAQLKQSSEQLAIWQGQILAGHEPALAATTLLRWLERREKLLQKRQNWLRSCRSRDDKQTQIKEAETQLIKALQNIGVARVSDQLAELMPQAGALSEQFSQINTLQNAIEERSQDLAQRQKAAVQVTSQNEHWQLAWQTACEKTWLGQAGAVPAIDQVREILNLTAELAPLLERSADMSERIGKMQQDQAIFRSEIEALAHRLKVPLITAAGNAIPSLEIAAQIEQIIQTARQQQQKLHDLSHKLEQAEQGMSELAQQIAVSDARKTDMLRHFDAENLSEVGQKIQAAKEKTRLEESCENEAQILISALKTTELAEAEQILSQTDIVALKTELQDLQAQDETQDQHKQEQYRLWKQAEQSLRDAESGDNSVAQLDEQRRTLLLEIEERSKRYLRLRFGITAAEQALRLYRDQHRSTMMARASEAFATISQGAYRQLTTQTDRDNEILIAIAADGSSKTAEELSKGTRFQLYLALRVAGYYEFIHAQRPMPFIADDIMETFDDDRSRETFQIFAQMAKQGQVIYLTHHQHLCDIAREVCPDVRMHELTPRQFA